MNSVKKVQLGIRLPQSLARLVQKEAIGFKRETILATIVQGWFAVHPPDQRQRFYLAYLKLASDKPKNAKPPKTL